MLIQYTDRVKREGEWGEERDAVGAGVEGCGESGGARRVAEREDDAIDTSMGEKVPLRANNAGRRERVGATMIPIQDHLENQQWAVFSGQVGKFLMRSHLPAVSSGLQRELRFLCQSSAA